MERNIKEKLFKFLFPNEYKELEEKRKKIKILNESIIHLKIELKERDTQLSGCIGEVTRLKMSTGRLEYELKILYKNGKDYWHRFGNQYKLRFRI